MSNMTSEFARAFGLGHKLFLAGEKCKVTPAHWNALAERPELLRELPALLAGHASITVVEHVIDCDANPFEPDDLEVEEHQRGGQFKFDASQIEFFLSAAQKKGGIGGNKLRKELAGRPVLNANVLDYLLANPHLIPEEWKKDENGNTRYIFFWGTIYRDRCGDLCVRYLYRHDGGWLWRRFWLGRDWLGNFPAAVRIAA